MATGVEELLDMLFEMIDEAKSMPLSSDKCILERDKALDLLDEIRAQFPMELAEAKKLIAARTGRFIDHLRARRRKFRRRALCLVFGFIPPPRRRAGGQPGRRLLPRHGTGPATS